jgi:acyl-CoA hydrolase
VFLFVFFIIFFFLFFVCFFFADVMLSALRFSLRRLHTNPSVHLEPATLIPGRKPVYKEPLDALRTLLRTGQNIWVHGAAATPTPLLLAMADVAREGDLRGIVVSHVHIEGRAPHGEPEYRRHFRASNLFVGANMRKAVNGGYADYVPVFLGQIPRFLESYEPGIDIALIQVTPPDAHGYCTLGPSVECTRAGLQVAKHTIALVNPDLPRTSGDTLVHESQIDIIVTAEHKLPTHQTVKPDAVQSRIGSLIAENLVGNGATLQMGIGAIPDAVLASLENHANLGIHSEMFSDGLIKLWVHGF